MARGGREQLQTKIGSAGHPSGMRKWRNSHERVLKPKSIWWKEEKINGHAMLLGCLLMAVRGLGFLMLTWITVVLLGGFVSNLGTVDFWSLTVIALLQIIGVFSLFHEWKYGHIGYFIRSLFPCRVPCCGREDGDRCRVPCFDSLIDKLVDLHPKTNCCHALVFVLVVLIFVLVAVVAIVTYILVVLLAFGIGISVTFLCWGVVTVVRYGPVMVAIWSMVRVLVYRRLFFTSASDGPGMFGSNASQLPNLTPAVDAAYWLGVAQGVVLLYWRLCYHGGKRIIKDVTSRLGLQSESETVRRYWQETAAGCEKDLSFVTGRNLMTYAVELLESKSPDKFLPGIRILGKVIRQGLMMDEADLPEELLGRLVLIMQLLTRSENFCDLIEELLRMLGPRSPYGTEIRVHAARIVQLVAHKIYLEEHPRCIQCVFSLLDAFEQHQNPPYGYQRVMRELHDTPYERDWCLEPYERHWLVHTNTSWKKLPYESGYDSQRDLPSEMRTSSLLRVTIERQMEMMRSPESDDDGDDDSNCDLQAAVYMDMVWLGLSILEKLAADEHNCSVMSSTDGLLPRIMSPLCSTALHLHGGDAQPWERIATASLAVVRRLVQATGEAGKALRSNISGGNAIRTVEHILQCHTCPAPALEAAMELLTLLCIDASLDMYETTKRFIQFLFNTFADGNCQEKIRTLAGRKLALLSSQKADMILTLDGILVSLKDIFLCNPRSTLGIIAVEIMDHLCEGNTEDGECHRNMKNVMRAVMPQVLSELFRCDGSTEEATPTGIEEATPTGIQGAISISIPPEDEGSQITSQGNSQIASSPSHQQNREAERKDSIEWHKALLSLSTKFFEKYASDDDKNLSSLLDEVAPKLTKMADVNMQPTADSLRIMKLITKLVISLVRNGYVTDGMDILMASLTRASNEMRNLDGPVLCSGVDDGGANITLSTFCSLVEEAQKLVDSRNAQEGSMVQDSSPRNN